MMNTAPISTPRFRTDLVAQPIDNEGQRFVDVTDPDSGRTFRFYEVEYSIACAMNGQRNVGGLANWALEELGLETTTDELETVITTLDELGYLDRQIAAGKAAAGKAAATAAAERDDDLGVELGRAGGTAPRAAAAAPPVGDLELGAPGKSPIARARPVPAPVEAVELGMPGAAGERAAARPSTSPGSDPGSDDDMSFEGLLDATGVRPAPEGLSRDDAPTAVRATPRPGEPRPSDDSDFGLEGLTPPPAEVPSASLRPSTEPASDDDGPTNLPPPAPGLEEEEVSVDLSEHLSIGADDLKEAVRQSQVMTAVTVPPELLAELEGELPGDAGEPMSLSEQAARQAPATPIEVPIEVNDGRSEPIELPSKRATVTKPEPKPPVEPPPQPEVPKSSAGILLVLLLFVLVGAGAAYYFLVYKKQQDQQAGPQAAATSPAASKPLGQTPVAPPAPPSAVLAETPGTSATIAMPEPSGAVEWLADDGAEVEAGDELVRLKGYARLEKKASAFDVRGLQYQEKLDRAKAALEKAADAQKARLEKDVAAYEAKVVEKADAAKQTRDGLGALAITAPTAGTVKVLGKAGAWVKAGEPLLEVSASPVLTATFTLPQPSTAAAGDPINVTVKGAAGDAAPTECEVTIVEGTKLTVRCPAGDLTAGAEIVLE